MKCPNEDQWLVFLDGQVATATKNVGLEAHLDQCPACRTLTAEMVRARVASEAPRSRPDFHDSRRLLTGAVLGRYQLIERLGEGGMGVVYAALDPQLNRRVAIKVMKNGLSHEADHQRLLIEARVLAKLSHPNVITVHDVGTFDAQVYVAMELIDGPSLRAFAKDHTWREVLPKLIDAGHGLRAAHRAGIVHGDFKPDNILISRSGETVVTDFGLSRTVDDSGTDSGELHGTPRYMAPEQLAGLGTTAASDQFAFCQTAKELLPGLPATMKAVLERGLSAEPTARFADLDSLLEALKTAPARLRRRWAMASAAIVLSMASIAIGATHLRANARSERCDEVKYEFAARLKPHLHRYEWESGLQRSSSVFEKLKARLNEYAQELALLHDIGCRDDNAVLLACTSAASEQLNSVSFELNTGGAEATRLGTRALEALTSPSICMSADWASRGATTEAEAKIAMLTRSNHFGGFEPEFSASARNQSVERVVATAKHKGRDDVALSAQLLRARELAPHDEKEAQRWLEMASVTAAGLAPLTLDLNSQLEHTKAVFGGPSAKEHWAAALADAERAYGAKDTRTLIIIGHLAAQDQGRLARAISQIEANDGPMHPDLMPLLELTIDAVKGQRTGDAETTFERIIAIAHANYDAESLELADWLYRAAKCTHDSPSMGFRFRARGNARPWAEEALRIYSGMHRSNEGRRKTETLLAAVLWSEHRGDGLLTLCSSARGESRSPEMNAYCAFGLHANSQFEEARQLLHEALPQLPEGPLAQDANRVLDVLEAAPEPPPAARLYTEKESRLMAEAKAKGHTYLPLLGGITVQAANATLIRASDVRAAKLREYQRMRQDAGTPSVSSSSSAAPGQKASGGAPSPGR